MNAEICLLVDFVGHPGFFLHLFEPKTVFTAWSPAEVIPLLHTVQAEAQSGCWVGGFLTYEAATAFGLPGNPQAKGLPLAWFATFKQAQQAVFPHPDTLAHAHLLGNLVLGRDWLAYQADLDTILAWIRAGDSYQVNHTIEAILNGPVDPAALFLRIQALHRYPYAAWVNFGTGVTASFSPELFLSRCGPSLLTAPIKGTSPRGDSLEADAVLGQALENSPKDRAEHIMIVDMARNDLGKICATGSVKTLNLFERRIFHTVHHLETRVAGRLRPDIQLPEIMAAMFPAASITGAPKSRTMAIIRDIEARPRGIYTGAIGLIAPGGRDFSFNVAIRTVTRMTGKACRLGLGGGIVADSRPEAEWAEIADKGRFLSAEAKPFQLIETFIVFADGSAPKLNAHLARLSRSASVLGFPWEESKIRAYIQKYLHTASQLNGKLKIVRLLLAMDGQVTLTEREHHPQTKQLRVQLADQRVDRLNPLIGHKTTRREIFDIAFQHAIAAGLDEALFLNNLGNITEGAIRAILVKIDGRWLAPPLDDGLLPSIWRQEELARLEVREKSLTLKDLVQAQEIRMGNAVQGGKLVISIQSTTGVPLFQLEPLSTKKESMK